MDRNELLHGLDHRPAQGTVSARLHRLAQIQTRDSGESAPRTRRDRRSGICIAAGLSDAPNQVGTWTFFVLWIMRWSAKLNLFLGAPNLHSEFLPEHLRFLESYMSKKPINILFPVSVTCATIVVLLLVVAAAAPGATVFETTGLVLVATLLGLAILEHWFLVVPLPDASLWRWAVRSTDQPREGRA